MVRSNGGGGLGVVVLYRVVWYKGGGSIGGGDLGVVGGQWGARA